MLFVLFVLCVLFRLFVLSRVDRLLAPLSVCLFVSLLVCFTVCLSVRSLLRLSVCVSLFALMLDMFLLYICVYVVFFCCARCALGFFLLLFRVTVRVCR